MISIKSLTSHFSFMYPMLVAAQKKVKKMLNVFDFHFFCSFSSQLERESVLTGLNWLQVFWGHDSKIQVFKGCAYKMFIMTFLEWTHRLSLSWDAFHLSYPDLASSNPMSSKSPFSTWKKVSSNLRLDLKNFLSKTLKIFVTLRLKMS